MKQKRKTAYCRCGSYMTASGPKADKVIALFWEGHEGPAHGSCTAAQCHYARRRADTDRDSDK